MSGYFCGNPNNHEEHDTDLGQCEGIHRPVIKEEVIIESWKPAKEDTILLQGRVYPKPPGDEDRTISWLKGWQYGIDLRTDRPKELEDINVTEFEYGYESALQYKVTNAAITPNKARELLGLKPYDPGAAGEVRTTSSTGGMKGVKPERYSLIPVEALDIMARLYGFGAEKYEAHNWRNGYEWSKSFDSLFRHATSALKGEDIDPETGLPHLAGAAFHCFTLMVFMSEHPEFDDRWKGMLEA